MSTRPRIPPGASATVLTVDQWRERQAGPSRRGLVAGLGVAMMAIAAGPAAATALAQDDGPQFLAWEQALDDNLAKPGNGWSGVECDRRCAITWDYMELILTTPCRSRQAAVVKLRAVMHPEIGLFSCGLNEHDEPAIAQVLAFVESKR